MNVFRHSVDVRCPATHAFAVFTARVEDWWPRSHRRLNGSRLVMEPGANGRLVERGDDGSELVLGLVREWEPPTRIAFAWRLGAPPDAPTTVAVTFTEQAGRTRVEVVHTEGPVPLPDWNHSVTTFERAWHHVLASFLASAESP